MMNSAAGGFKRMKVAFSLVRLIFQLFAGIDNIALIPNTVENGPEYDGFAIC
jgi:hypothetical protein